MKHSPLHALGKKSESSNACSEPTRLKTEDFHDCGICLLLHVTSNVNDVSHIMT